MGNTNFEISRRAFVAGTAAAIAATAIAPRAASAKRNITKSLKFGMISADGPNGTKLSIEDRFRVAKDAGFVSVEPNTIFDDAQVKEYATAAEKTGVPIDAIVCSTHWGDPLSDPDPAVYGKTVEGMRQSIRNAKAFGADMVLLVPAVVNPKVRYQEAWDRSIEHILPLADFADQHAVTIGIENVWNKFLLSPIESKDYIDEIDHPRVKYWFDVGNVVLFGYPQDWIRTLGSRIARVDIKDFDADSRSFVELEKGSVDWPDVMRAFDEIEYEGIFAAEVKGGDQEYLTKAVSEPMDRFIAL